MTRKLLWYIVFLVDLSLGLRESFCKDSDRNNFSLVYGEVNGNSTLSCTISTSCNKVVWFHVNSDIWLTNDAGIGEYNLSNIYHEDANESVLTIYNLTDDTVGIYACICQMKTENRVQEPCIHLQYQCHVDLHLNGVMRVSKQVK